MQQVFAFLVDAQFQKLRFRSAIAVYIAVLVLGLVPGARAEAGELAPGLVLHFVTYACIAFLLFTGVNGGVTGRALKTVILVATMGALDEYMQSFFPYRRAAVIDWCIDVSAGLFMAALLCIMLPKNRRKATA